jgi:hypothetical protein
VSVPQHNFARTAIWIRSVGRKRWAKKERKKCLRINKGSEIPKKQRNRKYNIAERERERET